MITPTSPGGSFITPEYLYWLAVTCIMDVRPRIRNSRSRELWELVRDYLGTGTDDEWYMIEVWHDLGEHPYYQEHGL